ncbi:MAG: PD40 domain-containing protein [Gemmatimonadetes bacterium]|nr:PD40 domain-containing protein [Gemmatimonadota bacterium]
MGAPAERLTTALADRYRIERQLGEGGMATVYLADDLRHHRKVALKVLKPELAATMGPDRFLQEVRVTANLQHPHILPLFDSGEADGFLYYVMPYLEGESLRERLAREGELPVNDALRILCEVTDALAAAHKHRVVHRDIKPDNVMLSGRHAMVTDFGVAKAVREATGRHQATTAGVALGTPAYMAPEQAAADENIDHRADIYAVGVLGYELLAGRTPFGGRSPQQILSAHMTEIPREVTELRPTVPPELGAVIMRCLEKNPADRWQSAEELLSHLEALATPSGGLTPTHTRPIPAGSKLKNAIVVGVAVVVAATVGVFALRSGPETPLFVPGPQTPVTRALGLEVDPAFSPDGRTVSYSAGAVGSMRLYVQQLGGGGTIELTEHLTGNHRSARWSPDGARLVYASRGSIFTIGVFGGTPRRVVGPSPDEHVGGPPSGGVLHSPIWSPDGQQIAYVWQEHVSSLAFQRRPSDIYVVSSSGGEPRKVTTATEAHSLRWSPDGSMLAYVSGAHLFVFGTSEFGNVDPSSIWVVESSGGEPVQVTGEDEMNISPVWWPDGKHVLFVSNRDGTRDIYQVAIAERGEPHGTPLRLTAGLNAHTIDLSADGARLTYSAFTHIANLWALEIPSQGPTSIGQARPVTNETQVIELAERSPDDAWIAFDSNREGNQDIYRMPATGGEPQRLTTHPSDDYYPSWSPSGREIAFYSLRRGNRDVFVMPADGGALQQLTDDPAQDRQPDWSPNGNAIAFTSDRTGRNELYLITRNAGSTQWSTPEKLTTQGGFEPDWSPDGNEIVYVEGGGGNVWRLSLESRERRLVVEAEEGSPVPGLAQWSRDGNTIYYIATMGGEVRGIWSVPASGGRPRLIARLDDLAGRFATRQFTLDGEHLYILIQEFEANVWVMERLITP